MESKPGKEGGFTGETCLATISCSGDPSGSWKGCVWLRFSWAPEDRVQLRPRGTAKSCPDNVPDHRLAAVTKPLFFW
eukprot:327780-Pelagomonas_calceolata.AAC.3